MWGAHDPLIVQHNEFDCQKGAKYIKLVVGYSLLVDVLVHGGMLAMASSWWKENVITHLIILTTFDF
jgi:hypothetical protein